MSDVLKAILIAAGILLPIVIFTIFVTITVVKRGVSAMHPHVEHAVPAGTVVAAKPGTAAKAMPRREFCRRMRVAWAAFTASILAAGTATTRFMFPNVLFEPPATFKAGFPNEIQVGQVDERFKSQGVWLVRDGEGIFALST